MNWLAQNWRKASLAIVLAVGIALPALAAYEKTGVFTPPDHHVKLGDNSALRFGDGGGGYSDPTTYDVTARWDGTDLDILANANNTVIKWGNGTNSFDQWLYGSSTSLYLLWDASANDLFFMDSVSAKFGNDGDVEMRWDGTDFDVLVATDDYAINFGNGTNSPDLKLFGNTTAAYALWDASADDFILADSSSLMFGTGNDVEIRWDNTDLDVLAAANNSVWKFGTQALNFDVWTYGASGRTTWDASADSLNFVTATASFDANSLLTVAGTADITGELHIGSVQVTSTAAELNKLAGVTAGTVTASKALVVGAGSALTGLKRTVTGVADNTSPGATDSGTVYVVTGGSGVTFTLPAVGTTGLEYTFCNGADQNMTITAPTDKLVTLNDAAATSIAFSTSGIKIGNCATVYSSATFYYASVALASDSALTVSP